MVVHVQDTIENIYRESDTTNYCGKVLYLFTRRYFKQKGFIERIQTENLQSCSKSTARFACELWIMGRTTSCIKNLRAFRKYMEARRFRMFEKG